VEGPCREIYGSWKLFPLILSKTVHLCCTNSWSKLVLFEVWFGTNALTVSYALHGTVYSWRWRDLYATYVRRLLWPPPCELLTSVITAACRHRLGQNWNCAGLVFYAAQFSRFFFNTLCQEENEILKYFFLPTLLEMFCQRWKRLTLHCELDLFIQLFTNHDSGRSKGYEKS
jgi:hypothetical protein